MHWCFWIYFLSLFTCYIEGTIQSDSQTVVGRVGESAVLGCSLLHQDEGRPPLYVIEWVRFGFILPIFIKFGLYSPRVDPQYLGRTRIEEGASLRIDSLRSDDQGWYECRVLFLDRHHADDFQNGTWIHLTVNSPPAFRETPPMHVEVRIGDTLTLTCMAYGNPQPIVLWKRDDVIIEEGDKIQVNNGSLRIVGVDRSTAGVYTCHAFSDEGEVTHTSRVLVQGPPVIVIPPENTTVNVSQDAFLTCQAEAYPANLTYSWFQGPNNVYLLNRLQSRVRILVDGSFLLQQVTPEDAGKYTCIPSNGMWKSPSASAYLTVLYPAYVTDMPPETYLPIGMQGVIKCPIRANPPLLFVNWTKDGLPLELDKFPGWHLGEDGSLVIATGNDDALGIYTCTPYNSYGTGGVSLPTEVILKDPPSFIDLPKGEYFQDVGRELIIPCSAVGDPPPVISWAKLGAPGRSTAQMDVNSSLVFRPLTKEEHGIWECTASNHVATISTQTAVFVLGTSPHSVNNVSAQPLVSAVNVSWVPGFDGGYFQRFTVWYAPLVKRFTRGHHDWISLPAPMGANHLVVENLQAETGYQFSILSQNKLGSGPFSEIVSATPLSSPPTTLPPPVPTSDPSDTLSPPRYLSANETSEGVLLQWSPPLRSSLPLSGYGLECRRDEGAWELLDESIPTSQNQLLVPGLIKDSLYEFRLVAFAGDYISDPSNSVNISTAGMRVYPSHTENPEEKHKSLMAGVVGGICFLSIAIVLSTVVACLMKRRRARRRRKRRQQDTPMVFSQPKNASPSQKSNGSSSSDSLMRVKLPESPYNSLRRSVQLGERSSNNLGINTSSRYAIYESNVGEAIPLERISRGPDGRFVVETETQLTTGSMRGLPYVTETDLYPEFNARDSSDLSQCLQAKTYLQVCQLPERAPGSWREEVKMRPKATGQARKEARDSGYRQGRYFGCSSSPMEEALPFRISDISPVTSLATLPYGKVEEPRSGDSAHTEGDLERTIYTLRCSEHDGFSAMSGVVRAPSTLLQKPLGVNDQESQLKDSLSTQSGILQYLSLPFFKEMSVDGEWPPEEEQSPSRSSEHNSTGALDQEAPNTMGLEDRTLMNVDGTNGVRKAETPCLPHKLLSLDYMNNKQEQSVPTKTFLKPPEPNLGPAKAVLPGSLLWTHPPENSERLKVGQRAHWGPGDVVTESRAEHHLSPDFECPVRDQPLSVFMDLQALDKQKLPVDKSLFLHSSEKVMRSSLTSQSSGRGSVSFLRPPSLAQSVGGSYLNSPLGETSSWNSGGGSQGSSAEDYRHRKDSLLATVSNRRNTSVDENYEWDSEFTLEADLLEALQVYRSSNGGRPVSTVAAGESETQSAKLPPEADASPAGSGSVDAMDNRFPQTLSSPEERCAALKEEFLEYQRRRRAAQKATPRNQVYEECYEQATLL